MRCKTMFGVAVVAVSLVVFVGCGKKTTKVDPIPEPPVAEAPAPAPVVEETAAFETVDMDAEIKAVFVPVYFDYDKFNLRQDAVTTMEAIARFMEKNQGLRVLVQGHADERGTDEYNMSLGENRALAARNYLTGFGIAQSRLEIVTYGKTRPANPECPDDACHELNRRVEWQILAR